MTRVSRGVTAHARHKKIIKRAKGYYGRRKNVFRVAVQAVEREQRADKRQLFRMFITDVMSLHYFASCYSDTKACNSQEI